MVPAGVLKSTKQITRLPHRHHSTVHAMSHLAQRTAETVSAPKTQLTLLLSLVYSEANDQYRLEYDIAWDTQLSKLDGSTRTQVTTTLDKIVLSMLKAAKEGDEEACQDEEEHRRAQVANEFANYALNEAKKKDELTGSTWRLNATLHPLVHVEEAEGALPDGSDGSETALAPAGFDGPVMRSRRMIVHTDDPTDERITGLGVTTVEVRMDDNA